MESAGLIQSSNSSFLYGCTELDYIDPNYRSKSPHYYDDVPIKRIQTPEINYSEILNKFGTKTWNFFTEGLKVVGIYHPINKFFGTDSHKNEVEQLYSQLNEQLNNKFKDNLSSISSAPHLNSNSKLTANLYSRQKLISFLEKLEKDNYELGNSCNLRTEITVALGILKASASEYLNIKEKAKISLSFDQLAANCEHALATKTLPLRDQSIAKLIGGMKLALYAQYVESAVEIITKEIAQGFKEKWKLGESRLTSYSGLVGIATPFSEYGPYVEGGAKGSYDQMHMIDAEGYANDYVLLKGGVYVEGGLKFVGEIPGLASAKATISAALDLLGFGGTFREPKTPLDSATRDFKTLIKKSEYQHLEVYFSRAKLLNQELNSGLAKATNKAKDITGSELVNVANEVKNKDQIRLDSDLLKVINEVENVDQIRLDFKSKQKEIDQRLSLYMSSLSSRQMSVLSVEQNNAFRLPSFKAVKSYAGSLKLKQIQKALKEIAENSEPIGTYIGKIEKYIELKKEYIPPKINDAFKSEKSSLSITQFQEILEIQARLLIEPKDKPTTWTSSTIKVSSGDVTEAAVTGFVGKLTVGGEASVGIVDYKLGDGENEDISVGLGASLSTHGSGEVMVRNRDEVKRTLIGLRYVDATKSDEEKASIKEQQKAGFDIFKNELCKNWKESAVKAEHTEFGKLILFMASKAAPPNRSDYESEDDFLTAYENFEKEYVSEEEFLKLLKHHELDPNLVKLRDRAILKRSGNIEKLKKNCKEMQECWELFENTPQLVKKNKPVDLTFDVTNINEMKKCLHYLNQDLEKYTALNNADVGFGLEFQTQEQKQKALREFEGRYGATSPEELIHRMHVASLYLLTNLPDWETSSDEEEDLKDAILKFEKELTSPSFAIDKIYLDDHLYFLEDLRITLYQVQCELETKAGLNFFANGVTNDDTTETPPETVTPGAESIQEEGNVNPDDEVNLKFSGNVGGYGKLKLGFTYQYLSGHRNSLRKGHSLLFSVTIGAGINIDTEIEAITPGLKEHLPPEVVPHALAHLREQILAKIALTTSFTNETTFDIYLAKPNGLLNDSEGFSFSHLFSRESQTQIIDSTGKKAIPCLLFDVVLGGGYQSVSTDPRLEICESNTILQFAILSMHEYDDGGINKVTGKVDGSSHWDKNAKFLNPFLINLAKEDDFKPDPTFDFKSDKIPTGDISREIFEFEKAVNSNPNYLKQLLVNFETERRASADVTTILSLREKIKAVKEAIRAGKKSNALDGVLKEYNFKRVRDKLKIRAKEFSDSITELEAVKTKLEKVEKKINDGKTDIEKVDTLKQKKITLEQRKTTLEKEILLKHKKALKRIKKFMHAFYPHFLERRLNSEDLKARKLAPVDDLAARRQQSKMNSDVMMMRCMLA